MLAKDFSDIVTTEERFDFHVDNTTLAGTLMHATPALGGWPAPVALLLSGSGPLDRDSNMPKQKIDVMKQVAEHLARCGVSSVRFDKRGVGDSGGDFHTTGFMDNMDDAEAALHAMAQHPSLRGADRYVIGHSAGALIAVELAVRVPELRGAVLLSCPATRGEDVLRWQAGRLTTTLPKPLRGLLRLLRHDVERTQLKRIGQIMETTEDSVRMQFVKVNAKWMREFIDHDPAASLAALRIPVLALTGSKDIQVDPDDVERIVEMTRPHGSGTVLENITHLLRSEPGTASILSYKKQMKRPVDPQVLQAVSQWIVGRAVSGPQQAPER